MKKKVLISIVGIVLFAVAITWNGQTDKQKDVTVHNAEAIADSGVQTCVPGGSICGAWWGSGSRWINVIEPIVVKPE